MITEYTIEFHEGIDPLSKVHWEFYAIKLGENLYYKGHNDEKIKTTNEIGWASHITGNEKGRKHAEELVELFKNSYDARGDFIR